VRTIVALVFMFVVIPVRIRQAARMRGRNSLAWCALAIGVWIAVQALVDALLTGAAFLADARGAAADLVVAAGSLVSVGAGVLAADRVLHRLEHLPVSGTLNVRRSGT
jgi:hypothetical protein